MNTIGRRGILGLIISGGASAAVAPSVSLGAAAAALGVAKTAAPAEVLDRAVGGGSPESSNSAKWSLISRIERDIYARRGQAREMPPHITGKKSWSPVYRAMVHAHEDAIIAAYLDMLRNDDGFAKKMLSHILGDLDG